MAPHSRSVSVVLPVYNGEQYMRDCLDAIAVQTIPPVEVIVVDNNCTDTSIQIAKQYSFVRVLREKRQGLSHARNAGCAAASGDIIVRIDADTVIPSHYIERLTTLAQKQPITAGFTGYGVSRYEFIPKISLIWSWCYFTFAHAYLGHPVLWGANMAIRKRYWQALAPYLINNDVAVHEDQDVSLALASVGGTVCVSHHLTVSVQMEAMLHYARYRKYGLMLQLLKRLDKEHQRAQLPTRLPKTVWWRRGLYWLATAWGAYGFYLVTFMYALYRRLLSR